MSPARAIAKAAPPKDADLLHLAQELATELGLKVSISSRGSGGTISIQYKTLDQFDDLYRRLKPA